jgi:hypothetical protein
MLGELIVFLRARPAGRLQGRVIHIYYFTAAVK